MAADDYLIACVCGVRHQGRRRRRLQILRCRCGRDVAVLPLSPLPAALRGPTGFPWLQPLLAGAITLLVMAVLLMGVVRWAAFTVMPPNERPTPAQDWSVHARAARQALHQGEILHAHANLEATLQARPPAKERADLEQLHRQTAMLADLLHESPAELAAIAAQTPAGDWPRLWERRYRHQALLLDAVIVRDPRGRIVIDDPAAGLHPSVRIDIDRLTILQGVPLPAARRVVVGLRLDALEPEGPNWVLRPLPESGVWVTDAAVLAASSLPPDPDYAEVLARQAAWQGSRSTARPVD